MKYNDYNENIQRGKLDFPMQFYYVDNKHQHYIMPLHWHKELEIIRVLSGSLNLFINNIKYTLHSGDIAFVNCKSLHRAEPIACEYECIVFDLAMMVKKNNEIYSAYINPIIVSNVVISPLLHRDNSKLYLNTDSLFTILKNEPPYYELTIMGTLFSIFEQLYLNSKISQVVTSKKKAGNMGTITELVKWIEHNYTEHITLDSLAEESGLTPNYLCRIFKEYIGKTPIEYVNFIRIENICYEIKWGQKSITEAAMDNGFNDISYFCKVFKKFKGISAKKYVQKI